MDIESAKLFAAAIALIPLTGVAIALAWVFSSYNNAIGRNPNAADFLDKRFFLTAAFTEAIGIFALVISLMILLG
jgi:F-type H+-transporting ATPase subunit c